MARSEILLIQNYALQVHIFCRCGIQLSLTFVVIKFYKLKICNYSKNIYWETEKKIFINNTKAFKIINQIGVIFALVYTDLIYW